MKFKRLSKFQIFALIVFGFLAIRFVFFRAPSEAQMIARFHEQRTEFDQLRSMLQQDKSIGVIAHDWIRDENFSSADEPKQMGLSEERLAKYRALMKKIGVDSCIRNKNRQGQEYFRFPVFGGGFTDTSWNIGYSWSQEKIGPLVKSAYSEMPQNGGHFSRIESNWYVYHMR